MCTVSMRRKATSCMAYTIHRLRELHPQRPWRLDTLVPRSARDGAIGRIELYAPYASVFMNFLCLWSSNLSFTCCSVDFSTCILMPSNRWWRRPLMCARYVCESFSVHSQMAQ